MNINDNGFSTILDTWDSSNGDSYGHFRQFII